MSWWSLSVFQFDITHVNVWFFFPFFYKPSCVSSVYLTLSPEFLFYNMFMFSSLCFPGISLVFQLSVFSLC